MLEATFRKGLHEVLNCHVLQERADANRPEVINIFFTVKEGSNKKLAGTLVKHAV
jgi:hypothetical protein